MKSLEEIVDYIVRGAVCHRVEDDTLDPPEEQKVQETEDTPVGVPDETVMTLHQDKVFHAVYTLEPRDFNFLVLILVVQEKFVLSYGQDSEELRTVGVFDVLLQAYHRQSSEE